MIFFQSSWGKYNGRNAQQLGNIGTNADARLANAEELVDEGTNGNEDGTNDPDTECTGGRIRVVVIVNDGTNLGVGRVLDDGSDPAYAGKLTWCLRP